MRLGEAAGPDRAAALTGLRGWLEAGPSWRLALCAMAAGAVGALAFAPFYIWPALAVTLSFGVWLVDGAWLKPRPLRAAFFRGFWLGAGHFLAGTYWVGAAFSQVDGAEALASVGIVGLTLMLSVFWGAGFALATVLWTSDYRRVAAFAAAMFFAEVARGHLFGGLPWNLAAYVWEAGGEISQLAAAIGAYGLTAVTLLILSTPATLADRDAAWAQRATPIAVAALLLGLIWGAGAQRLQLAGSVTAHGQGPVIRVVDPGLTQREKWTPGREWEVAARYLALTGAPGENDSEIVIWPEQAIPVRGAAMPVLPENQPLLDEIGRTLRDRVLIVGGNRVETTPTFKVFNTAFVIDSVDDGANFVQSRDKYRLTPFGEFIPLYDWISWLPIPTLQEIGHGISPGGPPARMVIPGAETAMVLICYESIFPGLVPRGLERPGWIVNISIDAWYGEGTGPFQNENQTRYRAIEEGLPLARAASGGISSVTDAYGRRVVWMDRKGGAVEAALPPALAETLFARFGGAVIPLAFLMLVGLRYVSFVGRSGRPGP